jgi:ribonuclease P protein component
MLPIKRRIKKQLFPKIVKEGSFVSGDNYYLRLLGKKEGELSNFAVVVPAKVKKTSVGRHLIKRWISAVLEGVLAEIQGEFYGIVFVKKDVSGQSYNEVKKEIIKLLQKAQMLK